MQLIENKNRKPELHNEANIVARPFLKWAGGKTQLLPQFRMLYPQKIKEGKILYYYEPFLGSGAVFFDIVQHFTIKHAWLYDINPELVITYQVIQKDVKKLIVLLKKNQTKYHGLSKKQQSEYYYEQRDVFNKQRSKFDYSNYSAAWINRAAILIFLNRTCFNGLYRVNASGDFNTPAGKYNNPTICDEKNLLSVSLVLRNTTIKHADFQQVKKDLKKNSFVYFDPPYRPLSKTASFKSYSKEAFTDEDQKKLFSVFHYIHQKGECVMLSNSDPKNINASDDFFDNLYADYNILRIPAKRMINAVATKRGVINELVVTNYL